METRMYVYKPKGEGEGVPQKTVIDGMGLKNKIFQKPLASNKNPIQNNVMPNFRALKISRKNYDVPIKG